MSEFVCPNTFCTFGPKLRMINQRERERERGGGGGGGSIYVWKGLFTGSPKISLAEPQELQEKSCCGRSLKCDANYQPQLKMLLLLHLWKELLQI